MISSERRARVYDLPAKDSKEKEVLLCIKVLKEAEFNHFFDRVVLARHGPTELNAQRVLQGSSDISLSEQGREEMEVQSTLFAQRHSDVGMVMSSRMKRAEETAKIFASKLPEVNVVQHPGLEELNHGRWEGMKITEILQDPAKVQWIEERLLHEPDGVPPHNGESFISFLNRVNTAVGEIHALTQQEPFLTEKKILMVSHAEVTRCIRFLFILSKRYGDTVSLKNIEESVYNFSHTSDRTFIKIPHGVVTVDRITDELKQVL